jgi:AraC-like DNA-binding protein
MAVRTSAGHRVSMLMRAIERDLQRAWTVSEMAALLGVSDTQLRRLCAHTLGATPRQLLCNLRLQAAAVLLHDPSIRVKEVQARVGVGDASHFCRDFRERFGMSPSEFRCQRAHAQTNSVDARERRRPEMRD